MTYNNGPLESDVKQIDSPKISIKNYFNEKAKPLCNIRSNKNIHASATGAHLAGTIHDSGFSPSSVEYAYLNLLHEPVWVTGRDNIPIRVDRANPDALTGLSYNSAVSTLSGLSGYRDSFLIIETRKFTAEAVRQIKSMFANSKNPSEELRALCGHVEKNGTDYLGYRYSIVHDFPMSKFIENRDGFYNIDTDTFISSDHLKVSHPFVTFNAKQNIDNILSADSDKNQHGFAIELVLNSPITITRYFNFFGTVYELVSKQSPTRKDGIHFYKTQQGLSKTELFDLVESYMSIDDLTQSHHFYSNIQDAKNGSTPDGVVKALEAKLSVRKTELNQIVANKENELKLLSIDLEILRSKNKKLEEDNAVLTLSKKQELEALKHANEVEIAELTIKLKREAAVIDKIKDDLNIEHTIASNTIDLKKEKTKAEYDERSHARKDTSEIIKLASTLLPIAISAVAAIAGFLIGRSGKTKEVARGLGSTSFASFRNVAPIATNTFLASNAIQTKSVIAAGASIGIAPILIGVCVTAVVFYSIYRLFDNKQICPTRIN